MNVIKGILKRKSLFVVMHKSSLERHGGKTEHFQKEINKIKILSILSGVQRN